MDGEKFKTALPSIPNFFCMPVDLIHQNTSKFRREETADLRRRFLANKRESFNKDKLCDQRNEKHDTTQKDTCRSAPHDAMRRNLHRLHVKTNKSVNVAHEKPRSAPPKSSFEHLAKEVFKRPELERLPYFVEVHADPRPPFDYPTATLSSAGCFFSKVSVFKGNNRASQSPDNRRTPNITHASKRVPSPKPSTKSNTQIQRLEKVSSTPESGSQRKNSSTYDKYTHRNYGKTNTDRKTCGREFVRAKHENIVASPEVKASAQRSFSANISTNRDQMNASRKSFTNHVTMMGSSNDNTYDKRSTPSKSFAEFSWNDQERKILMELKRNQFQGVAMNRARHCKDDLTKVTPKMRSRNHFIDPEWSSEVVGWARYAHPSTQKLFRFSWI